MTESINVHQPKVCVVLLQWNHAGETIRCLESLAGLAYHSLKIIVVDNGSHAAELDQLMEWTRAQAGVSNLNTGWGTWCRVIDEQGGKLSDTHARDAEVFPFPLMVICESVNKGFAEGNNVGIRHALREDNPEFVWLLNNDTEVTSDALSVMVNAMRREPSFGVLQSCLLNAKERGRIDSLGIGIRRRSSVVDEKQGEILSIDPSSDPRLILEGFGACAASALFRACVLQSVGLFDPAFFAVFEDADLAFRIRYAGWRAGVAIAAVVYHKRGVSGRKGNGKESRHARLLKYRNATALKIQHWPFPLLVFSPGVCIVLAKALLLAAREGTVWETLLFWTRSLRQRCGRRSARNTIFNRWADHPLEKLE